MSGDSNGATPNADDSGTHPLVRDVRLASGRTLALITLHTGDGRPATFGPATLTELEVLLDGLAERAASGQVDSVGVTGRGSVFAAGADLGVLRRLPSAERGLPSESSAQHVEEFARHGQRVFAQLADLPVPSFAFVNGSALGGGLELALHTTYRTVSSRAGRLGLPEVSLGLVPGWGGSFLLPNLIGVDAALDVVLWNPLRQNRTLTPPQALEVGLVDAAFPAVRYLEDSLRWADAVLDGEISVARPHRPDALTRIEAWPDAIDAATLRLDNRYGRVPQAPWAALQLLAAAVDGDRTAGYAREDRAIAALATGNQFAAARYAGSLIRRRGKNPAGAPDRALATPITKIGVIGAGLMARQFALLFLRKLQIPVVITDLDQVRVDTAVAAIHTEIDRLHTTGRIDQDTANRLSALLSGTTDLAEYAGCDLVIEAVFEDLAVKHQVLTAVEQVVRPDAILATNTSSLSVEDIGRPLADPQRLVGFHFFNPVAVMPLIEIVRTPHTDKSALSTAFVVAAALGKTAVLTADSPGFVVNRLLAIVMGEAAHAVDQGTPLTTVERAFTPVGLPMTPFQLIDLVSWKVAAHVQDTMAAAFPDRFHRSENLHRMGELTPVLQRDPAGRITGWSTDAHDRLTVGSTPLTAEQILRRVQDGLAREIAIMLADGVVTDTQDIDLCMILGAGWPQLNGGITPYLDREGASSRTLGDTFHHPTIAGRDATARTPSIPQGVAS